MFDCAITEGIIRAEGEIITHPTDRLGLSIRSPVTGASTKEAKEASAGRPSPPSLLVLLL
jgi:hypothetical protein